MQWKPVVSGALAGFAVTLIFTTLGAAIGFTAGAASHGADGQAVGIGAGIWWLLTVIAAGFVGGRVLSQTARRDAHYYPVTYGMLTWVLGVIILLFLLAIGVGNMIGGLGGGMAATAARHGSTAVTPADSARVVQDAANVGTGTMWALLLSQLAGLGATIVGAGKATTARGERERERERIATT